MNRSWRFSDGVFSAAQTLLAAAQCRPLEQQAADLALHLTDRSVVMDGLNFVERAGVGERYSSEKLIMAPREIGVQVACGFQFVRQCLTNLACFQ